MPDDDGDLDANEKQLLPECPPDYAISRSAPPALDVSLAKRYIMVLRGLGCVNGVITGWVQARRRQDDDYSVVINRTGAAISVRHPLGKCTAFGESAPEGSWVLLVKANSLSKMLQR